jgi:hypothetical protein
VRNGMITESNPARYTGDLRDYLGTPTFDLGIPSLSYHAYLSAASADTYSDKSCEMHHESQSSFLLLCVPPTRISKRKWTKILSEGKSGRYSQPQLSSSPSDEVSVHEVSMRKQY